MINELLADVEDSSSEEECLYQPIVLPLKNNRKNFTKHFKIKNEIKVKQEDCFSVHLEENYGSYFPSSIFNNKKEYNDDNCAVSLIKFPDSLPSKSFSDDVECKSDCTLNRIPEGQIGKVIVRKSGKVEVTFGNTKYKLETEEPPHFSEDVMVVPSGNEEINVVKLAPIKEHFVLSPSWEDFFFKQRLKKS